MKNKPRTLQRNILSYALAAAKICYPAPGYKVSTAYGKYVYVDKPFPDGSFASVLVLTIKRD